MHYLDILAVLLLLPATGAVVYVIWLLFTDKEEDDF